ncbi:MAG: HlyD family secretion protein [Pseudomonadales bacterium]|nr:HlyD family secretion protein [Pseudomonadales bacterium]
MSEPENLSTGKYTRKTIVTSAVVLLTIIVVYVVAQWLMFRSSHVSEIDARVKSAITLISSTVPGRLVKFSVSEGQLIKKGDLIAQLDSESINLRSLELDARIRAMETQIKEQRTRREIVNNQTASQVDNAKANLDVSTAEAQEAHYEKQRAENDYQRALALSKKKLIATRQLEQARSIANKARENHRATQARAISIQASYAEVIATRQKVEVFDDQIETLQYNLKALEIQKLQLAKDMQDRSILSPINGVVDQTFVHNQEYVSPGQRLILIHDPANIWVSTNIKESEISQLRNGQAVDIHVDAYPDQTFSGTVELIGTAATSQFALIPSPNPSGNFTKITQRIPVRISVNSDQALLKPGMMVEVDIDITDD